MSNVFTKVVSGVRLVANATTQVAALGDIDVNTTNNKLTFHNGTIASPVVTEAGTATLSNKSLDNSNIATFKDSSLTFQNASDATKQLNLSLAGLATSTNAVLGVPVFTTDTLVTANATQTLTNKTFSGGSNTITGLTNANLSGTAGITNANLATMATLTIKGNNTGGSSTPLDLTVSQVNTMLGDVTTIGSLDTNANANGLFISGNTLSTQSASATVPGLVNNVGQSFGGIKTFTNGAVMSGTLNMSGQTITNLPTITNTGTLTLPTATDTLVGRATTDTLTNKTFGDAITSTEISTPSNPSSGQLKVYSKSDNNLYTLNSSGVETQVGSGSGGIKNYLGTVNNINGNGNFELGTTGKWSLAHSSLTANVPSTNATATNAFSSAGGVHGGSAANANLSFSTASGGNQLAGAYSGSYISTAASVAGDMLISDAFTIDVEDQAKVLGIKVYYKVVSGLSSLNLSGSLSNSLALAVYDVTNAQWINPPGAYNFVQGNGVGIATATFQTSSNGTQYQLALYNANASSGAFSFTVDDFSVSPQVTTIGPSMTDWIAYTPTFTNFGTVTAISMQSRRVGDSLEVAGKFTTGTTVASALSMSIGYNGSNNNVVIDTTKIPVSSLIGTAVQNTVATTYFGAYVQAPSSNLSVVNFAVQTSTVPGTTQATGNNFPNATVVEIVFTVPIVGWSSNAIQSSDTLQQLVAARGGITSGQSIPNNTPTTIQWNVAIFDTTSSLNISSSGVYTVPVSGKYQVYGFISGPATATGQQQLTVRKNGVGTATNELNNTTVQPIVTVSDIINCNAGDTIDIQYFQNSGSSYSLLTAAVQNGMYITRLSGPAVVQATESVNAKYQGISISFTSGGATITGLNTKVYDSHNAMSASIYTVPVSGKYRVTANFNFTALANASNGVPALNIVKNGSIDAKIYGTSATGTSPWALTMNGSDTMNCNAGDTISLLGAFSISGAGQTTTSTATDNYITIERVGN